MLPLPELRIAFQQLPKAIVRTAELLIKWGEGGRGASLSQPQGPSVLPCYRQTLALSYTSTDLGRQRFRYCRNLRSGLISPTLCVPFRPLGMRALWQRGDSLGFACA